HNGRELPRPGRLELLDADLLSARLEARLRVRLHCGACPGQQHEQGEPDEGTAGGPSGRGQTDGLVVQAHGRSFLLGFVRSISGPGCAGRRYNACRVVSRWAGETKPPAALSGRCKDRALLRPTNQFSRGDSAVPGRTLWS